MLTETLTLPTVELIWGPNRSCIVNKHWYRYRYWYWYRVQVQVQVQVSFRISFPGQLIATMTHERVTVGSSEQMKT